jgi:hypothetical protein
MMTILDREKCRVQREAGARQFCMTLLLFGSMGAITWAIRGTSGWGGVDGTIVPGMTWGLLWWYLCYRRGIDARTIPLWLGLGIAVGGELGYGQYVSWIRGMFEAGDTTIPVSPWIGYAWFAVCGAAWAAPGGVLLGWALGEGASRSRWVARLLVPLGAGFLGWMLVQSCPSWFFPNHDLGLYAGDLDRHLVRTVETNTRNFVVVCWGAGALFVAALQRDRTTLAAGALLALGFGAGFPLSAAWCLGYSCAPGYIDWWKMWELNAGFNLGLLYAAALWWAAGRVDRIHPAEGDDRGDARPGRPEAPKNISLILAVFLLLSVLFFGGSYNAGVLLGLYRESEVGQYAWPPARLALFAPFGLLVLGVCARKAWNAWWLPREQARHGFAVPGLPERMTDLMTVIAAVGAATIWPSKIGVLYAVFLCTALHALARLNRGFDAADACMHRTDGQNP